MLGSREEAEEVLQDTFLRVYREASRYDPARGAAKAFVYTVARNLALSRLRRQRREPPKDLSLDPQDPEGEREEALGFWERGQEERVLAARALESLSSEERVLLEEVFYKGLSHRELAERTGLPLGTVKARIRRALLKLRQLLGEV
ncbi:RNA polymerase sigma factor [Thermus thermophilus]|nr:RNA polymerase sigma factor [Thermus thermophilus]